MALGQPLLAHRERVQAALQTILARQPWTIPQRQWLERIGKQLEQEAVVDREAIDSGQFKAMGGYQRLNRIFQGQLDDILHDLAEAMWRHVAGSGIGTGTVRHCGPWDSEGLIRVISAIEGNNVSLTISDALLQAAHMSEAELRQEIAVMLFQRDKLTLAQASQFAHMRRLQFQHMLASRQIPVHYDVAEFAEDIHTLQRLGRL